MKQQSAISIKSQLTQFYGKTLFYNQTGVIIHFFMVAVILNGVFGGNKV